MTEEEALRRMAKLVNWLLNKPDAAPFSEPVDWRAMELFDYPKIVKKPMDLGTVKRKLDRDQYVDIEECAQDIRLIWNNCKMYNADGSDFYLLASSLSKRFEDRYQKILAEYDASNGTGASDVMVGKNKKKRGGGKDTDAIGASGRDDANLDVKMAFASKLFQLSGMELGHILKIIDLKCPKALEQPDPSAIRKSQTESASVEINVDKIDSRTFAELDRYVKEKLLQREHSEDTDLEDTVPKKRKR
jgi:hypothetical protein